jgi:uncharacterized membrane protein
VVALLEDPNEVQKAVEELLQSGFDRKEIGVISSETLRDTQATIAAASKGIALGGLAGMLLGAATLLIPGIGLTLVAGPALPLLGAAFGALAGGLIMGLTSRGVPEDDAHAYAEGLRRGGALITVVARNDGLAAKAAEVLKRHGAVDIDERRQAWRKQGWSGRFEHKEELATAEPVAQQQAATQQAPDTARAEEPVVIEGVRVYSFVIEVPEAANQASYSGPERRLRSAPYQGAERRLAA